jgi:uncharacterized membrane protein YvbJ
MFCPKCGAQNQDNVPFCATCGAQIGAGPVQPQQPMGTVQMGAQPAQQVQNYLVFAILTTIFCCLPFGIAAIVFASQVNTKLANGDINGAIESSNKAKMWCWLSFGLGLFFTILYIIMMAAGFINV